MTGGQIFSATTELELSTESILGRPVAKMALSEYAGSVGSEFVFDASSSHSVNGGGLNFDWDLDGDGIFELSDAGAVVRHVYDESISGFVQVRVREGKLSSTMSAKLSVTADGRIKLSTISELSATLLSESSARVSFRTDADKVLLAVDDAALGFLKVYGFKPVLGTVGMVGFTVTSESETDPKTGSILSTMRTEMPMISIFAFIDTERWRTIIVLCD